MLPPTFHPNKNTLQRPRPETQPSRTAGGGRADPATRERPRLPLGGAQTWEWGMWPVLGGILLLVGVIAFFRYLAAAQVAGGCCGGGLVVLAGLIFLVIGLRDRGDFSR